MKKIACEIHLNPLKFPLTLKLGFPQSFNYASSTKMILKNFAPELNLCKNEKLSWRLTGYSSVMFKFVKKIICEKPC